MSIEIIEKYTNFLMKGESVASFSKRKADKKLMKINFIQLKLKVNSKLFAYKKPNYKNYK